MKDFDILEQLVNPCTIDRLGEFYQQDEIYQKRLGEENIIYEKLRNELTDEQKELLESYFLATTETAARKETLTYIQGMKDMLTLLKALSK